MARHDDFPYVENSDEDVSRASAKSTGAIQPDPYAALGVPADASQEVIKRAYRTLALRYHPDKAAGQTAQFQKIQAAYSAIGDRDSRANYDARARREGRHREHEHTRRQAYNDAPFSEAPFSQSRRGARDPPREPPREKNWWGVPPPQSEDAPTDLYRDGYFERRWERVSPERRGYDPNEPRKTPRATSSPIDERSPPKDSPRKEYREDARREDRGGFQRDDRHQMPCERSYEPPPQTPCDEPSGGFGGGGGNGYDYGFRGRPTRSPPPGGDRNPSRRHRRSPSPPRLTLGQAFRRKAKRYYDVCQICGKDCQLAHRFYTIQGYVVWASLNGLGDKYEMRKKAVALTGREPRHGWYSCETCSEDCREKHRFFTEEGFVGIYMLLNGVNNSEAGRCEARSVAAKIYSGLVPAQAPWLNDNGDDEPASSSRRCGERDRSASQRRTPSPGAQRQRRRSDSLISSDSAPSMGFLSHESDDGMPRDRRKDEKTSRKTYEREEEQPEKARRERGGGRKDSSREQKPMYTDGKYERESGRGRQGPRRDDGGAKARDSSFDRGKEERDRRRGRERQRREMEDAAHITERRKMRREEE